MKIRVIFDGPPSRESGRFVEVENERGQCINAGQWVQDSNGLWALEIEQIPLPNRDALIGFLAESKDARIVGCGTVDFADALLGFLKGRDVSEKRPISELLRREVAGAYEFDHEAERNTGEIIERSAEILAIVEAAKTLNPAKILAALRDAGEELPR